MNLEPWQSPPAYLLHPKLEHTAGYRVADFISELTLDGDPLVPDPDQRNLLALLFAGPPGATYQTRDKKWAASTVGLIAPRQNIKTSTAQFGVLGAMLILDARDVIWTAHVFHPAAADTFAFIARVFDENRALNRQLKRIRQGSGTQAIELTGNRILRFLARSKGGGRSLKADIVVLDEAYDLTTAQAGAILPTRSARPNSQVWNLSSAGRLESSQLRKIRDLGRGRRSRRMLYAEWCGLSAMDPPQASCADPKCSHVYGEVQGCVLDDEQERGRANSTLGRRISPDTVQDEREQLDPLEFARERVGWWDRPGKAVTVISGATWSATTAALSIDGSVTVAVDVALDRSYADIAVVGRAYAEGDQTRVQFELADRLPVAEAVLRVADICESNEVEAVGIRNAGPVLSLVDDLVAACAEVGVELHQIGAADFAGMCGAFYDAMTEGTISHLGDPRVGDALEAAKKHTQVDAWTWERMKVDVDAAPLVAVTTAHGLWLKYGPADEDETIIGSVL